MEPLVHPSASISSPQVGNATSATTPKEYTLAIVRQGASVILGWKKRGFGTGRLMGFGGKVESGESILSAARRELQEECGISARRLDKKAHLTFHFQHDPRPWLVHTFEVLEFEGQPQESEEMKPQVFPSTLIPYDSMFPDDILWLPPFLEGKSVVGEFWVSSDGSVMDKHSVQVMGTAPLEH